MVIERLGTQVKTIWDGLRPLTQKMLAGALSPNHPKQKFSYDIQADWELSRLLTVLDEQLKRKEVSENPEQSQDISELAETCISVLQAQTESAEVFIQLAERALRNNDYKQLDTLADTMRDRFVVGEMCEIVRQSKEPAIRAIALENIALMEVEEILPSYEDPVYEDIARQALIIKAIEYDSAEARNILENFELEDDNEIGD